MFTPRLWQAAVQKIVDIKAMRMNQKKEQAAILGAKQQESDGTWQANQDKTKARKEVKKRVDEKLASMKDGFLSTLKDADKKSVVDQIRDFEFRLSRQEQAPEQQSTKRVGAGTIEGVVNDVRAMEKDVQNQMSEITKKKKAGESKSLAREKRRRKFIKLQEEAQIEGYYQLGTEMIREQLSRATTRETQVSRDLETINKNKAMLTDNREFRTQQYKERTAMDAEEALKRDNAYLDSSKVTMTAEIAFQQERLVTANVSKTAAELRKVKMLASNTLTDIVELALNVAKYREYANHFQYNIADEDPAPLEVWNDMKRAFVNVQPLIDFTVPLKDEREWGETTTVSVSAEDVDKVAEAIDRAELDEYIGNNNMWSKFAYKVPEGAAPASEEAPVALGMALVESSLVASPFPALPPAPVMPEFPLKMALFGPSFAGKTDQAQKLADRYNLKLISTDAELESAIKLSEQVQMGTREEPKDDLSKEIVALGRQAYSKLVLGGEVEDEVYVGLALCSVKRLAVDNEGIKEYNSNQPPEEQDDEWMGWVIDDFPRTIAQAVMLEKALTGYDHDAHVHAPSDRAKDLAPLAPDAPLPFTTVESGIDIVVGMSNDVSASLRRSLGRRLDPETGARYHLDTARPPYDLICKERLVSPLDPKYATANLSLQVLAFKRSMADTCESFYKKSDNLLPVDSTELTVDGTFAVINRRVEEFLAVSSEKQNAAMKQAAVKKAEDQAKAARETDDGICKVESEAMKLEDLGVTGLTENIASCLEEANALKDKEEFVPELSQELAEILMKRWEGSEMLYKEGVQKTFRSLREERLQCSQHLHDVRVTFDEYLAAVDDKQLDLDMFVAKYNKIDQDMRFDERTKAELGLLVEELRNSMWVKVEEKKRVGLERLKDTVEDGWVEKREHCLKHDFAFLMQLEVDRFFSGVELLSDRFSAVSGNEAAEGPLEGIGIEEEVDPKAKGGKKKDDKKDKGKKGKKGDEVEEEVVARAVRDKSSCKVFEAVDWVGPKKAEEEVVEDPKAKIGKGGKKGAEEVEVVAVDVLQATLEKSLKYATGWSKEVFVVEEAEEGAEDEGEEAKAKKQALYEALWHEAEVLKGRVQRLYDVGVGATDRVGGLSKKVYDRIGQDIEDRVEEELKVVEECVAAGQEKIIKEEFIHFQWRIQSLKFEVDVSKRLVAVEEPEKAPVVEEFHEVKFNEAQMERLEGLVGGGGECWYVDDVVTLLLRLGGGVGDELPGKWMNMQFNELWGVVAALVEEGEVEDRVKGAKVIEFFKSSE